MKVLVAVVLAGLLASASAAPAQDTSCATTALTMKYEAFIAGVNAGEANLRLTMAGAHYRVEGSARSKGLWESLQQWRAEYSVLGELAPGTEKAPGEAELLPSPGHFYSLQTTPRKRREIHIENGVLRETKNHKVRDPRPAQTGYDLLSALFFLPACHDRARIHTGRDGYEFTRLEQSSEGCRYAVVDEDGERYRLALTYRQFEGLTVPSIISVHGPLPGRMVLVDSAPVESSAECGAAGE